VKRLGGFVRSDTIMRGMHKRVREIARKCNSGIGFPLLETGL